MKIQKSEIDKNNLTIYDYKNMSYNERLLYDKRNFLTSYWHTLIYDNSLLSVIFNRDIYLPLWFRILLLIMIIDIDFGINSLFYLDVFFTRKYEILVIEQKVSFNKKINHFIYLNF